MNCANIAKPSSSPARLVKRTGRWANIFMSTMGSLTRRSVTTHTTAMTIAPAKEPRVRPDVQPHSCPCEMGRSSSTSSAARVPAPSQSVRPPVVARDAGTVNRTPASATTASTTASQKTRW